MSSNIKKILSKGLRAGVSQGLRRCGGRRAQVCHQSHHHHHHQYHHDQHHHHHFFYKYHSDQFNTPQRICVSLQASVRPDCRCCLHPRRHRCRLTCCRCRRWPWWPWWSYCVLGVRDAGYHLKYICWSKLCLYTLVLCGVVGTY